jgi:hypothetical protein
MYDSTATVQPHSLSAFLVSPGMSLKVATLATAVRAQDGMDDMRQHHQWF